MVCWKPFFWLIVNWEVGAVRVEGCLWVIFVTL